MTSWTWGCWPQFLFFCLDPGSASRCWSPTSMPRIEILATVRDTMTPIMGAQSQIQTTQRGSVPVRGRRSRAWCSRAFRCECRWRRGSEPLMRAVSRFHRSELGGHSPGLACRSRAFHRGRCGLGSSVVSSPWLWWIPSPASFVTHSGIGSWLPSNLKGLFAWRQHSQHSSSSSSSSSKGTLAFILFIYLFIFLAFILKH